MKLKLSTIDDKGNIESFTLLKKSYTTLMPLSYKDCIICMYFKNNETEILIKKEKAPNYITLLGKSQVYFDEKPTTHPELPTTIIWENTA